MNHLGFLHLVFTNWMPNQQHQNTDGKLTFLICSKKSALQNEGSSASYLECFGSCRVSTVNCTDLTAKDLVSEDQMSDVAGKVSDLLVAKHKKKDDEASAVVVNGSGVCPYVVLCY